MAEETGTDFEAKFNNLNWSYKRYSRGWLISCPNKEGHKSGDSHFSCAVWPEVNWFRCFGCGREGRLPKLFSGTGEELSRFWSINYSGRPETPENVVLDEDILNSFRKATAADLMSPGFEKRGWSQSHIDDHNLLFDPRHGNLVYPVYSPELVGAVGRNALKKSIHNYFGFSTGRALGGLDRLSDGRSAIIVVEGWTCLVQCAAWAHEMGYDVVCTFTANVTRHQIELLADIGKPLIFMFDQDKAGRRGVEKAGDLLDGPLFARNWNPRLGDVGAMPRETFESILG